MFIDAFLVALGLGLGGLVILILYCILIAWAES